MWLFLSMLEAQPSLPFQPPMPRTGTDTPPLTQHPGHKLFASATEFYDWLMGTSMSSQGDQSATYQRINQLLRIADCSSKHGQFLTASEEDNALETLRTCRDQILNGQIRTQDILDSMAKNLHELTQNNPKALLVARLTEIEYMYYIYPMQQGVPEAGRELKHLLDQAIATVNPQLLDIKALELARDLASFTEADKSPEDLARALKNWLSSNLF